MTYLDVLEQLAERIASLRRPHPLRVAIDGIDAAGKTTLADDLVGPIEARGRTVIRASIDGFHRPRAERCRQGEGSPTGYYEDSIDYAALREALLLPLGPGGNRLYERATFDHQTDTTEGASTRRRHPALRRDLPPASSATSPALRLTDRR